MKKCNKCNVEKEVEEFSKDKTKKDGYSTICKKCRAEYAKTYNKKNRGRRREYVKENIDMVRETARLYHIKNKNRRLAQNKKYREENREALNEYLNSSSGSERYIELLVLTDDPKMIDGVVTVICRKCGERIIPAKRANC